MINQSDKSQKQNELKKQDEVEKKEWITPEINLFSVYDTTLGAGPAGDDGLASPTVS